MSNNKLIPIIVAVICIVIVGCAFGISAHNKDNNDVKIEAENKTQAISQSDIGSNGADGSLYELSESSEASSSASAASSSSQSTSASSGASSALTTTTNAALSTKPSSVSKSTTKPTTAKSEYIYAYAGFNPVTTDMSVPIERLLLNRKYKLPDGYVPKLATAAKNSSRPDIQLDYRVAPYYQKMYDAALKDGITLTPVSGYRSYERQKNNFENQIDTYMKQGMNKKDATIKASQIRLLPGTSEHNAGLAMDICSLSTSFDTTKEFKWLQAHAHEYGFIMRYPKDKTNITNITYEPWHYRYVGVDIATQLKNSGQVLEEYLGKDS